MPLPPAKSSEKSPIVTTASTAAADDSRQLPARRLEIVAASSTPATMPITVLVAMSPTNSRAGSPPTIATQQDPRERKRQNRAGGIVECGFRDDRLGDLRPQP